MWGALSTQRLGPHVAGGSGSPTPRRLAGHPAWERSPGGGASREQAAPPREETNPLCGTQIPLRNLNLLPPAQPRKRWRAAGPLSASNKSQPTALPETGLPAAQAQRRGAGAPSPGLGSPKAREAPGDLRPPPPSGCSSVGRWGTHSIGRRVGSGGRGSAWSPLCSQVPGPLCPGPNLCSQFGIRANPSVFLHACRSRRPGPAG